MIPSQFVDSIQQASLHTPYPGNVQAGYAYQLSDQSNSDTSDVLPTPRDPRFHENLAHYLDEGILSRIGNDLTNAIKNDDAARQKWLRVITDTIDYLGLGGERAKNVYSSRPNDIYAATLMKCILHTSAELFSLLFPAQGFLETEVLGDITKDQELHASRIKDFMNYIFNNVMTGYKPDKKQSLFWMIIEGSVYSKPYICPFKKKPVAPYVRASDVIIDSGATCLADAERVTHEFSLSDRALKERFENGQWRKCTIEEDDFQSDVVRRKVDQKMGVMFTSDEHNKYHSFYETLTYLDIKGFEHFDSNGNLSGRKLPYIVTKDKNSDNIVSIYRHWNEFDPLFEVKQYLIQYKYFTGFNVNGLGMAHLTLGLAKAETELQQQLIKAAQLSNAPSLLMDSGLRGEKTQIDIKPGSLNQFQTFGNTIQNSLMPLPFKEPSSVLLQLKDSISTSIMDYSATFELKPENMPPNMSATAVLGILTSMHKLENSLLNDLYESFQKEFQFIYTLIGQWLPEKGYPFLLPGSQGVMMKSDFSPNISIRPVMDPNLSSQAHKLIVGDALLSLAEKAPDLYDIRKVHERLLTSMHITNIDEILLPDPKQNPPPLPAQMDPISENKTVMEGNPIKAYKDQDHQSHITIHQNLIDTLSQDQTTDHTNVIAELKNNIQEHRTFQYIIHMELLTGITLLDDPSKIPPVYQNQIAVIAAQKLQEEQQHQQAINPAPPDPNTVMMEDIRVKEKAIDAKTHESQSQLHLDEMRIVKESENESLKLQIQLKQLELAEKDFIIQQRKLDLADKEIQLKMNIEFEKIKSDRMKSDLNAQSKAFDSTLNYQKDHEINDAKIVSDEEKASLDAQTKAFTSTLTFNKNDQKIKSPNTYEGNDNG